MNPFDPLPPDDAATYDNLDLVNAFPLSLKHDVLKVISTLPEPDGSTSAFSVHLSREIVTIPYRVDYDPALIDRTGLTPVQAELLDCLLTRHHSGLVREQHLAYMIGANHEWIPPFVVQLAGEQVIEILNLIHCNLPRLDPQLYRTFLQRNPEFFALTKERVLSYWDRYYRSHRKEHYVGFEITEFFEQLFAG